jgi:hypothetical protein
MPGLALKQAVERVLARHGHRIDADQVAAWLIPDTADALGRDRSAFVEVFSSLQSSGDGDRPNIPRHHFGEIASFAASTTLARRCDGATPDFYEAILRHNMDLYQAAEQLRIQAAGDIP